MTIIRECRHRCSACGWYSHGSSPTDAGFEPVRTTMLLPNKYRCPECGHEAMESIV